MTLAELLRQLRREDGPTDVMRAGSALHAILEHPQADELTVAEHDGHRFHFLCDAEVALLPYREIPAKRTYTTASGEQIELRGRADDFGGLRIAEHKFTTSTFDAERYYSRYQWRAYLSIFGATKITYNIFEGHFLGTEGESGILEWEIRGVHALVLYTYPEIEADITRELALYSEFAHRHLIAPMRAA